MWHGWYEDPQFSGLLVCHHPSLQVTRAAFMGEMMLMHLKSVIQWFLSILNEAYIDLFPPSLRMSSSIVLKMHIRFLWPSFKCLLCLCVLSLQSCPTLCNPMDCSPPGSSVHGILQARTLEGAAVPSSRGASRPRDWTRVSCISCIGRWILYN